MDVISMRDFSKEQILAILDCVDDVKMALHNKGKGFREKYGYELGNLLDGTSLFAAFAENSTRTNFSFQAAADRAGASVRGFPTKEYTSLEKGETWGDTFAMIAGWGYDAILMRSTEEGLPRHVKEFLNRDNDMMGEQHKLLGKEYSFNVPMIINGGDGKNQHPTQCFLDLYTMRELARSEGKELDGLELALLNDLKYGRTNSSIISVAHLFDFKLHFAYPRRFGPKEHQLEDLRRKGVEFTDYGDDLKEAMSNALIAYHSRPQKERVAKGEDLITIAKTGRITRELYESLGDNAPYLMHPKPVDAKTFREIDHDMINHSKNVTNLQASNGLPVRIALLAIGLGRMQPSVEIPPISNNFEEMKIGEIEPDYESKEPQPYMRAGFIQDKGVVLDHIPVGMARRLEGVLNLEGSNLPIVSAYCLEIDKGRKPVKDIIKIHTEYNLSQEQLEAIALISPDTTINIIDNGRVVRKFKAVLGNYISGRVECGNNSCISNVKHEPIETLHWVEDNGILRCNYCEVTDNLPNVYQEKRFTYIK